MLPSDPPSSSVHPVDEGVVVPASRQGDTIAVQTPGGVFHIRIDHDAQVSAHGGMVSFAQFLDASGVLAGWESDCPLVRTSPNASSLRSVLGTWIVAVTAGQSRYAHITGVRGDRVTPQVLGFKRLVSEDTVRRALGALVGEHLAEDDAAGRLTAEAAATAWSQRHLLSSVSPLLAERWIMDLDVTIKPLYGYQEGSVVGHNPHKPGRPSHALHTFLVAGLRLVVGVEVHPGDEHTAATTKLDLTDLLSRIPRERWPYLLRGDCAHGNENMMEWPENHGLHYLFKVRKTKHTREMIEQLDLTLGWSDLGDGWQAKESRLRLSTWTRERRAVVLRRLSTQRYPRRADIEAAKTGTQSIIAECEPLIVDKDFEHQVLITSLDLPMDQIAQLYRDRADAENVFDELKKQWGWGGFTSHALAVTKLATRLVAQVYNWWSIFVRLVSPTNHREAVTTRPALLHSIVRQTGSGGQRFLAITSNHHWRDTIGNALTHMAAYFTNFALVAEQLTQHARWEALLNAIFARARAGPAT
jgi:hypothetical protein